MKLLELHKYYPLHCTSVGVYKPLRVGIVENRLDTSNNFNWSKSWFIAIDVTTFKYCRDVVDENWITISRCCVVFDIEVWVFPRFPLFLGFHCS